VNKLNCTNKQIPDLYYGFIYKTTLPDGKIYIGQTTNRFNKNYYGSGTNISKFINENGKSCLNREILKFVNSQKSLNKFEEIFIRKFKSYNENIGLNIFVNTSVPICPKQIKYIRDKISKANIGHEVTEEVRQKLREANLGKIVPDHVRLKMSKSHSGKTISESTKIKMRKAAMGNKSTKGMITINDGFKVRLINKGDLIPQGYKLGRLKRNKT